MTTSVTSSVLADLQAVASVLKADLLQIAGPATLTFLQTAQTVAANLEAIPTPSVAEITEAEAQLAAAWVVFQAAIIGSVPNLDATLLNQLLSFLITKIKPALPAAA